MNKIRVTKEFSFELAHALDTHNGQCRNIHGHSYKLEVCVIGILQGDEANGESGMVMDFANLKEIVKSKVVDILDHSLVLYRNSPYLNVLQSMSVPSKLILFDHQPTCEHLLVFAVESIRECLPGRVALHHIRLRETATSYAEWFADDNP
jgi:6-pyruvoyltetrahydropterin/6-carboxytetrahydropterin synthase